MLFLMKTVKFSAAASRAGLDHRRIGQKLLWLQFRMSINKKSICEQQKCAFK